MQRLFLLFITIFLITMSGCNSSDNTVSSGGGGSNGDRNSTSRGFGVSGLLFENNLVMFDREHDGGNSELFPQMYFTRADVPNFPTWGDFPTGQVVSGGVARDGIPAVEPSFVEPNAGEASYVADNDLVLGVVMDGEVRAYPHNILWWHEIINDNINGQKVIVTLCPLTGTGMVFYSPERNSGFDKLELLPVVETTWRQWQKMYPDTRVVSSRTGFDRNYTRYPYSSYREEQTFPLFPLRVSTLNNAFPPKHMVLGILEGYSPKAYPFSKLEGKPVVNDEHGGRSILVVSDISERLAIPFDRNVNGQILTFTHKTSEPFEMTDNETNSTWNLKGQAISGALNGTQLTQIPAHNAFWFAWWAFWPATEILN